MRIKEISVQEIRARREGREIDAVAVGIELVDYREFAVDKELAVYVKGEANRIRVGGEDVGLPPESNLTIEPLP